VCFFDRQCGDDNLAFQVCKIENFYGASKVKMTETRKCNATVFARLQRDPKFARALHAEAVNALLEGETNEGLSVPRNLFHAASLSKHSQNRPA
jgi:hypothetical protein